jgi:hypothetical protein
MKYKIILIITQAKGQLFFRVRYNNFKIYNKIVDIKDEYIVFTIFFINKEMPSFALI